MTDNLLPATPETPKLPKLTETKRIPPRKEQYFSFERLRKALQTVRGHDRHRQSVGLRPGAQMGKGSRHWRRRIECDELRSGDTGDRNST
jgi:hypothetical protein